MHLLIGAATAASGEGALVAKAKLAVLSALAAAVGADLAVGQSLWKLVHFDIISWISCFEFDVSCGGGGAGTTGGTRDRGLGGKVMP